MRYYCVHDHLQIGSEQRCDIIHNDRHHPHRQRSNICHELSHCFLGHKCTPPLTEDGNRTRDNDIEAEANFLAGVLLITNEAAIHIVREGLVSQAQSLYGVSGLCLPIGCGSVEHMSFMNVG